MAGKSSSRLQISRELINQWAQCVMDRMENPPAKCTTTKIVEAFFNNKIRNETKHIKAPSNGGEAIPITDDSFLSHLQVQEAVITILQKDIQDLAEAAPIASRVSKAMLEIYKEESEDPGIHFTLDSNAPDNSIKVVFQAPTTEQTGLISLREEWRDYTYSKFKKERPKERPLSKASVSGVINRVFAQFPDWQKDDFLNEENEGAIYAVLDQIKQSGGRTALAAEYLKKTL